MSKSDAWMPFFVGDYLSATGRLTTEQHGAYLLILLDYWKNGPPPNDDAVLAAIARLSPAAWRKAKAALIGFFEVCDGMLIQKRVEKERARASEVTEERSKAGKAGAAKRWQNGKQKNGKAIANAIAEPLANGQQIDAPSPSQGSNEPIQSSDDDSPSDDELEVKPEDVFEHYQALAKTIGRPVPRDLTPERRQLTRARIAQYPFDDFRTVFANARASPFLRGDKGRTPLTFDWLMKKANFQKTLEGNYNG